MGLMFGHFFVLFSGGRIYLCFPFYMRSNLLNSNYYLLEMSSFMQFKKLIIIMTISYKNANFHRMLKPAENFLLIKFLFVCPHKNPYKHSLIKDYYL